MVELALDSGEVRKNISMIKLKVIEYGNRRAVVNKLGALIKKGRVILIGLYYKGGVFVA